MSIAPFKYIRACGNNLNSGDVFRCLLWSDSWSLVSSCLAAERSRLLIPVSLLWKLDRSFSYPVQCHISTIFGVINSGDVLWSGRLLTKYDLRGPLHCIRVAFVKSIELLRNDFLFLSYCVIFNFSKLVVSYWCWCTRASSRSRAVYFLRFAGDALDLVRNHGQQSPYVLLVMH